MAALPPDGAPPELPRDGLLAFFYDAELQPWGRGFEGEELGLQVRWFGPGESLGPATPPAGARAFQEVPLGAVVELTLPESFAPEGEDEDGNDFEDDYDTMEEIRDAIAADPSGTRHRIGGYDNCVQNPIVEDAPDAVLLLQLDSDDTAGWMWGDVGTVYVLIGKDDLAAGRFEAVRYELQCC